MMVAGSYILAGLVGLMSMTALFLLQVFVNPIVFFSVIGVWAVIAVLLHRLFHRRVGRPWEMLALTLMTIVAFVSLTTLIESRTLRIFLLLLTGLAFALLHLPPAITLSGPHTQKTFRRIYTMLWVFVSYATVTSLFAIPYFFSGIALWILVLGMGVVTAFAAYMIWRMYFSITLQQASLLILVSALSVIEIAWVVAVLPFGYLVSGFLITWIWYILQLLLRFHCSNQDILWRKQARFLLTNAALFIVFLYFVRWV